jgi:hypothetical protein
LTASLIRLFLQTYTEEFSGIPLRNFCMVETCTGVAAVQQQRQQQQSADELPEELWKAVGSSIALMRIQPTDM